MWNICCNSPSATSTAGPFPTLYSVYTTAMSLPSTRILLLIFLWPKTQALVSASAATKAASKPTNTTIHELYNLFIWNGEIVINLISFVGFWFVLAYKICCFRVVCNEFDMSIALFWELISKSQLYSNSHSASKTSVLLQSSDFPNWETQTIMLTFAIK